MTIANIIKTNPYIVNRDPISLSQLREYVQAQISDKQVTPSALRNVFIGNNDYYKFNYVNIGHNKYIPRDKAMSHKDVVELIAGKNQFIASGLTLRYMLNNSYQNINTSEWIIFGNRESLSDKQKYYLEFFDEIKIMFLDIENDFVEVVKTFIELRALHDNTNQLTRYLTDNKITVNKLIKLNMLAKIYMSPIWVTIDKNHILYKTFASETGVDKVILDAMMIVGDK